MLRAVLLGLRLFFPVDAIDAECPATVPLMLPANGCRFGTAVAAVTPVPGASYAWSIEGGDFVGGLGTDHVTIALGGGASVKVSVAVATANCTSTGSAVIALHDAFTITSFTAAAGVLGQPQTISWEYANGSPQSQVLIGSDFGTVTLSNDARSYSYTPLTEGDKNVMLQARSGAPPAAAGRPHAAGRGTGAASDCNVAAAKAAYHVDCSRPDATIFAPASVGIDTAFTARVRLDSFSTAKWTIANGTPSSATGESVVIRATGSAAVEIGVVVTAGNCSSSSSAHIPLVPSCDNPTAEVVLVPKTDCSIAVQAHFTGRPPFRGAWNDGVPFVTSSFTAERIVTAAGTFSVAHVDDAFCSGGASNAVTATPHHISAVLSQPSGSCTTSAQAVATLTGTPPFTGVWSDGQTFTTSSNQVTRQVTQGGILTLQLSDATCGPVRSTNDLAFGAPGNVVVTFDPSISTSCLPAGSAVKVLANVVNGFPPYTLTWSDGFTQTVSSSTPLPVTRFLTIPAAGLTAGITAAHDAVCTLTVSQPISLSAIQNSRFVVSGTFCPSQQSTATLNNAPVSGSSIGWSLSNGTIVSGQGTTSIKFVPGVGASTLSCAITAPSGCSGTSSVGINGWGTPAQPQPVSTPSPTVAVGGTVKIAWTIDGNTQSSTIDASTIGNQPAAPQCSGTLCSASYVAKTTGTVTFTVHAFGHCGEVVNGSTSLTVQ